MSAAVLREAAAEMRLDARAMSDVDNATFHAVADWLARQAKEYERYAGIWAESHKDPRNRWGDLTPERNLEHHFRDALAVARAYLGADTT